MSSGEIPSHDISTRTIAEAGRQFEALIKEVDLRSALKELDKVIPLGLFGIKIALHEASPGKPAHHVAYVECMSTPEDLKSNTVGGWKNQGGWWEYSAAGKTVNVYIVGRDAIKLQSIVGACMEAHNVTQMTTSTTILTQGLILRTPGDGGTRWGLTVGHGFNKTSTTHADNKVFFCSPQNGGQCQHCVADECDKCTDPALNVAKSLVAAGVDEIKTMYPEPSPAEKEKVTWIDYGVHKIPTGHHVQPLNVRNVKTKADLDKLATKSQAARDAVAGLNGVSTTHISEDALRELVGKGVFCFQKGRTTGWSFGKIKMMWDESFVIEPLSGVGGPGDCGAIWFVIVGDKAWPAGYYFGSITHPTELAGLGIAVPYCTAWTAFEYVTGIPEASIEFVPEDSYAWSTE